MSNAKTMFQQIEDKFEFDHRDPDNNWRGHVGHAYADETCITFNRSYADPFEGTNLEKLVFEPGSKGGVVARGWDESGRDFKVLIDASLAHVADALLDDECKAGAYLLSILNRVVDPDFDHGVSGT